MESKSYRVGKSKVDVCNGGQGACGPAARAGAGVGAERRGCLHGGGFGEGAWHEATMPWQDEEGDCMVDKSGNGRLSLEGN